jgi:very-short-patch-repair endonuclease
MANAVRAENLRNAIANAIAENVKSYNVEDVCVHVLGLPPAGPDAGDPFNSKRVYVRSRLIRRSVAELEAIARKVIDEYGDEALEALVAQLGVTGVGGELKNLIFAANGPKPRIVLRDAINNVIEITENAQFCLVYDRPLSEHGLSWRDLTTWWASAQGLNGSERENALSLYYRLLQSMVGQPGELLVFETFAKLYGRPDGFDLPALMPQVYLHYDPYTRHERMRPGPLVRQRMDFLLLLPNRQRVVIEVDGRQHYTNDDGYANTSRYAEMVREDRSLRLAGYEVYRFGGKELEDEQTGRALVRQFCESLLDRHGLKSKT